MAIYRAFWLEFCLSTGIRGFSYIAKSKQKTEHFLWLLVVSTFIILTFYDVTNTCLLYVSEETVSRVTVKSNSTINLGTPTICLEFNVAQMSPDLSKFDLDLMLHRHNETNLTDLYLNPNVHTDFNSSTMFLLTLITLTKIVYAEQFVHPSAPVSQFSLGILSDKIRLDTYLLKVLF